jgi:hypothetical protein
LNDAYNPISRIVVTEVLLLEVGNVIDPRLMFNTDSSSHFLNADAEMTLLTSPGVVDDLNNQNRNPTKTKTGKEDQRRSISYTPIINNAGEICAMTTNIKDHSFNGDGKVKTYKVSDKVYIQTIPTGPKPSTSVNNPEIEVDYDDDNENDVVEMATGQAGAELYEEKLLNNFARQAAYQYLNGIYLPVMVERRRKAIREDDYTKEGATSPISVSSSLSSDSSIIRYTVEEEAEFLRLESDPKYAIVGTLDGERNGSIELLRMFEPRTPNITIANTSTAAANTNITETADTDTDTDTDTSTTATDTTAIAAAAAVTDIGIIQPRDPGDGGRLPLPKNLHMMKSGASCSKIEQILDRTRGGFMSMHQFLDGTMYKSFVMEKASKPLYMDALDKILANIPASSRRSFTRAMMVMDLLVETAFSKANLLKGAALTGAITDGQNSRPNYKQMLMNCPPVKAWCDSEIGRYEMIIKKCMKIATELNSQRVTDPHYLGTPDDGRMEQDFAEIFGKVHIGTGETSSREKVTELEFIRWRSAIFGAPGQYNRRPKTATQPPRVLPSSSVSNTSSSAATPNLSLPTTSPSSSSSSSSSSTSANILTDGNAKKKRAGKKCSNINCPTKSRYDAALCKTVWTKCPKNCAACGDDDGGSVHVCGNQDCKNVLAKHINPS